MEVSALDEETLDLDWFAIDKDGTIGHFVTGGQGVLPRSSAISMEDLAKLKDYFGKEVTPTTTPTLNPRLDYYVKPITYSSRESRISLSREAAKHHLTYDIAAYLKCFTKMASSGLFSFDCLPSPKRPTGYFQVAQPQSPILVCALPAQIREIVGRTVFRGISFRTLDEVSAEQVVSFTAVRDSSELDTGFALKANLLARQRNCTFGGNGPAIMSMQVFEKDYVRIYVDNPYPGHRPAQIHAQVGHKMWHYDPTTKAWRSRAGKAPFRSVLNILESDKAQLVVIQSLKLLGEDK